MTHPEPRPLRTPRLVLRKPRMHDVPALVTCLDNLNVSRTTGRIPFPYSMGDAEDFVHWSQGTLSWLAFNAADNHLVGGVGCHECSHAGTAELGYWVREADWGQGYGREMAHAAATWFFAAGHGQWLEARYAHGNTASQRILEGLGFVIVGEVGCTSRATGETLAATGLHLSRALWFERKDRHS